MVPVSLLAGVFGFLSIAILDLLTLPLRMFAGDAVLMLVS